MTGRLLTWSERVHLARCQDFGRLDENRREMRGMLAVIEREPSQEEIDGRLIDDDAESLPPKATGVGKKVTDAT
jgi:hypothetical protein